MSQESIESHVALQPFDSHNQQLMKNVHPTDWIAPNPASRYNLVVIGAGTAGLVTAAGAAGLGAKVALVERDFMGGDCLNVGCVPSKAIIAASRQAARLRELDHWGIQLEGKPRVDFPQVMERMRRLRASISPHDSAARFRELGVDVFFGEAHFRDSTSIQVEDSVLRFKKAVIATGARAYVPDIPGLSEIDYLTNESIFSLTDLPAHLLVIGGGPIGCELAQAFRLLGSNVTVLENSEHVLSKEDADAARLLDAEFRSIGIEVFTNVREIKFERHEQGGQVSFHTQSPQTLSFSHLLLATGRAPNVKDLQLENANVEYDLKSGIHVNDLLQTTNKNVFSAGDVCYPLKFTHAADFMARTVIQNALFPRLPLIGGARAKNLLIPWCTYTSPEIAHVGLSETEAKRQGISVDTYRQDFDGVDRSILDGETNGFVKIHCRQGSGEIVGATIVGSNAGDLISEIVVAMNANRAVPNWLKTIRLAKGFELSSIASSIHPYPTVADAIRKVGDQYNRTRLTPTVKKWLERWMRWTR